MKKLILNNHVRSLFLQISNSESNANYLAACKKLNNKVHPARFPAKLPEFFIKFLTEPGDTVLDIFSGSNTTGYVAEQLKRKWLAFDSEIKYNAMSAFRFIPKDFNEKTMRKIYDELIVGKSMNMDNLLLAQFEYA